VSLPCNFFFEHTFSMLYTFKECAFRKGYRLITQMILDAVRKKDVGTLQALLLSDKQQSHASSSSGGAGHTSSTVGGGILSSSPSSSVSVYAKSPTQHSSFPGKSKKKGQVPDPNGRDDFGYTPLHLAVTLESMDLVDCLLKYSPRLNVNLQDFESGYTDLHKVRCSGILSPSPKVLISITGSIYG
jgi:hypothetical protein